MAILGILTALMLLVLIYGFIIMLMNIAVAFSKREKIDAMTFVWLSLFLWGIILSIVFFASLFS